MNKRIKAVSISLLLCSFFMHGMEDEPTTSQTLSDAYDQQQELDSRLFGAVISNSETEIGIVQLLIDNGADVDKTDSNDYTALRDAASGGCKDGVELLIQHGATDNDGKALEIAKKYNEHEIIDLLERASLEKSESDSEDFNSFESSSGEENESSSANTVLSEEVLSVEDQFLTAVSEGNIAGIQTLLDNGHVVDISAPFHIAATNRNANMLKLLIDNTPTSEIRNLLNYDFNEAEDTVVFSGLSAFYNLQDKSVTIVTPEGELHRSEMTNSELFSLWKSKETNSDADPTPADPLTIAAQSGDLETVLDQANGASRENLLQAAATARRTAIENGHEAESSLPFVNCANALEQQAATGQLLQPVPQPVPQIHRPPQVVQPAVRTCQCQACQHKRRTVNHPPVIQPVPQPAPQNHRLPQVVQPAAQPRQPNPNRRNPLPHNNPFVAAAQAGHIDEVRRLAPNASVAELMRAEMAARAASLSDHQSGTFRALTDGAALYLNGVRRSRQQPAPRPAHGQFSESESVSSEGSASEGGASSSSEEDYYPVDPLIAAAQAGNIDEVRRLAPFASPEIRTQAMNAVSYDDGGEDCYEHLFSYQYQPSANSFKRSIPLFCGIATAATACGIFYYSWSRKRQLSALEHAAQKSKELVLTIAFDCFNAGDDVRGLQERFDVPGILQTIGNEEKRTALQNAIEQFDTALQETYNKVMSHYYDKSETYFAQRERQLVNKLEICFGQLQSIIDECLDELSVGVKGWTALGIGALATIGLAAWAA